MVRRNSATVITSGKPIMSGRRIIKACQSEMQLSGTLPEHGLGIVAVIASVAAGSAWLAGIAVVLLVPAVVILHRVGRSLP